MNTVIKLPFQGRYRFVFKDGWDKHEDAMIVVREQQRTDGLGDGQGGPIIWEQTGISACRNDKLWFQERDQYNHIRWVNSGGDCRWQSTAVLECRTDGLYRQEKNYSGDLRWVKIAGDCGWQPTGERECRPDHKVWQKERNRADEIRWTDTGLTCYDPTYPLPCGGWAFGPGDVRDPAASKQLADCHDGVGQNIWVYPAPGPGHTIPVADCEADHYCLSAGDIEGYAANVTFTGVRDKCFDGVSGCTTGASILGKG